MSRGSSSFSIEKFFIAGLFEVVSADNNTSNNSGIIYQKTADITFSAITNQTNRWNISKRVINMDIITY